jgi:hypothetical protein
MIIDAINEAQFLAHGFIQRADEYAEVLLENNEFDRKQLAYKSRSDYDGNWGKFFQDNAKPRSLAKASSALRRQSMELTRALAEMRKP